MVTLHCEEYSTLALLITRIPCQITHHLRSDGIITMSRFACRFICTPFPQELSFMRREVGCALTTMCPRCIVSI